MKARILCVGQSDSCVEIEAMADLKRIEVLSCYAADARKGMA